LSADTQLFMIVVVVVLFFTGDKSYHVVSL